MAIMYYLTPPEEECKAAALEYKKTRDPKLFNKFLIRYIRLGPHVYRWMRQRNEWFKTVEKKDAEQTTILGIYKAFSTIGPNERPEYIPLRVISYIKHELTTTYHYVLDEYRYYLDKGGPQQLEAWIQEGEKMPQTTTYTRTGSENLDDYKHCPGITDLEAGLIQKVYVDRATLTEISKTMNVSVKRVHFLVKRIQKKLHKVVSK